jgi:hypothetical protein
MKQAETTPKDQRSQIIWETGELKNPEGGLGPNQDPSQGVKVLTEVINERNKKKVYLLYIFPF